MCLRKEFLRVVWDCCTISHGGESEKPPRWSVEMSAVIFITAAQEGKGLDIYICQITSFTATLSVCWFGCDNDISAFVWSPLCPKKNLDRFAFVSGHAMHGHLILKYSNYFQTRFTQHHRLRRLNVLLCQTVGGKKSFREFLHMMSVFFVFYHGWVTFLRTVVWATSEVTEPKKNVVEMRKYGHGKKRESGLCVGVMFLFNRDWWEALGVQWSVQKHVKRYF